MCHLRRLKSISAAREKTEALQASEAPSPLKKINTKKPNKKWSRCFLKVEVIGRWGEGDGARLEGVTASLYVSASHCDELTKPKASPADP